MQKQLQLLRDLQELDTQKKLVLKERQCGLDEQHELKAELDRQQQMADSLAEEIGTLESEKSELVDAMAAERQNIERSESRLPQIKTQKEYVAVLKEIDTAKKLAKELQAQIDAKNEALASLAAEKAEKDEALTGSREQVNGRCADIDASLDEVAAKLAEMDRQRNTLMAELPKSLRKRYELLMDRRAGLAVVEASGGACMGCHMHLPPQLFNSLFIASEIQSCPHCNRLLFVLNSD